MKRIILPLVLFFMISLSGCEVIGGIFKAGAITGIVAVVVVLILVIWLVSKIRGNGNA